MIGSGLDIVLSWDLWEVVVLKLFITFILSLLAPFIVFSAEPTHPEHAVSTETMSDRMVDHAKTVQLEKQPSPLGISESREGSGTSWLPDTTPMYAIHAQLGEWKFMFHGNLFLQYIEEEGRRGDSQFGSINWIMAMAKRPLVGGELGLRTMLSAEPLTVEKCGYPDLLASGEFCDGEPIHDHQHPHDLFMELAAFYKTELSSQLGFELYGGPAAEPALGPTAFPHRVSAFPDPIAPITHHWLDSTHISFGVVTAGLFGKQWKVESSVFNGREPDENRTDLDLAPMDSLSGRIQYLPSERWSLQVSAGHLNEAEQNLEDENKRIDVDRYTASTIYHRLLPRNGVWASTLAIGRNVEEGQGTNAVLLESSYNLANHHIFTGRIEWVEKTGHDLDLEQSGVEDRVFPLVKIGAGYTYQWSPVAGLTPGLGGGLLYSILPSDLESAYGERMPVGYVVFLSLRPGPMNMEAMNEDHGFH